MLKGKVLLVYHMTECPLICDELGKRISCKSLFTLMKDLGIELLSSLSKHFLNSFVPILLYEKIPLTTIPDSKSFAYK